MLENLDDGSVLKLANILSGNQVEPKAVEKALELICRHGGFDCGLVYSMNLAGEFSLMEHYEVRSDLRYERLPLETPVFEKGIGLSQNPVFHIKWSENNSPMEEHLLKAHKVEYLTAAIVADENGDASGIVILYNVDTEKTHSDKAFEKLTGMLSMLVHYLAMRLLKGRLEQAKTALENILDNTGIDIYVNDFITHEILYVNESMAAPYGGKERFFNQKCWKILFPDQSGPCEFCPQKKLLDENGEPTRVYTWDYQRYFDGSWFRVFSAAFRWVDGRLAHVVSSADITDNKQKEALIERLANYDPLTNLPNRRMLITECERRINNAGKTEQGYLLFFDIDDFKKINDTLGHDAGDEFLIQLGKFFTSIPMLKDTIYRNGGDEFVAIIGGVGISKENIRSLTHLIHERFKYPWKLKKGEIYCNTSIGIACFPEDGRNAEILLQKADMAMYNVKKTGGGKICFGYEL